MWRFPPSAIGRGLRRLAAPLGNLLFPPTCPGCRRLLLRHEALCPSCWTRLSFIEAPVCAIFGTPFSHDLGEGALSAEAIANPPNFDRLRSACRFDDMAQLLVHALKYGDHTELAPMMAGWMVRAGGEMLVDCDVVIPVPLHRLRRLARRYNQAAELARPIARTLGKPMLGHVLLRRRNTPHQVGLGRTARQTNLRGAFAIPSERASLVAGKHVLLVDDVYTTGATVAAATRVLRRAGARQVTVLTFATALADII